MSADKHKKRDRAFAFLRRRRWGSEDGIRAYTDSPDRPSMLWLAKKGFGAIKRLPHRVAFAGYTLRRNYFIEKD